MNITPIETNIAEEYREHLLVKNRVICSFSRFESFSAAVDQIGAAAAYTVVAQPWVSHNTVYIYDEEGFMATFHISEGT